MKPRIIAYLQLVRFPNIFTAMADVLAGYLIVMGRAAIDWFTMTGLLVCTSCLYGAGCVLNDVHDRSADAREHPLRPIPSGRVSVREAQFLACILYGTGLTAALYTGLKTFTVALFLAVLTISYDLGTKDMGIMGPLNMGACRSFNLILGMSPAVSIRGAGWIFPAISLCYVFYVTLLSRSEDKNRLDRRVSILFGSGFLVIIAMLCAALSRHLIYDSMIFLCLFFLLTVPALIIGLFRTGRHSLGRAVTFLILGIPFLDAVYASGIQGWALGVPVALCIVPSIVLSRFFHVT